VTGAGGREPVGILTSIEAAAVGSQVETVGGIDKSVHQFWNNQYRELASLVNFGDDVGGIPAGILLMMQLFLDCSIGTSTPWAIFTNKAIGENVLRAFMGQYGIRSTGKIDPSVDMTPHNATIFGKPVISTGELPADTFVALTLNNSSGVPGLQGRSDVSEMGAVSARDLGGMYTAYHPQVNMTLDGPRVAGAQHAEWSFFLHSMCNIFENMAQQGRGGSADVGGLDNWS
jgi:hypothetical protein